MSRKVLFVLPVLALVLFVLVLGAKYRTSGISESDEFADPIKSDLLNYALLYPGNKSHLVFKLLKEEKVFSLFDGIIVVEGESEGAKNIQIKRDDGIVVSYLFVGRSLVKLHDMVKKGQLIALIEEGKSPSCLARGNLGVYLLGNEGGIPLTPDMLKGFSGVAK